MRSVYQISMILLTVWFFTSHSFAYDEFRNCIQFLLGVSFKAQGLRDQAIEEIRKIDLEIMKNEQTIQKSQQIISLASHRIDENAKKAEIIAREALMKATEAKQKNEAIKRQWELAKMRAERSFATVQNMLSQRCGLKEQIKGFLTNYTGNVYIIKANHHKTSPENGFLGPGDKVLTANGTAEVQMLDGRATVKLGPYSEFVMKKDTREEELVELLKGKVYMTVDKIDEFTKKMREKLEQYKEDIQTIKQLKKEDIDNLEKYIKRELKISICNLKYGLPPNYDVKSEGYIGGKHYYCINGYIPNAVLGVRGTKFISEIKDDNSIEVMVLEGIVDVNIPGKDKVLSLEAGDKAIIGVDDIIKLEKIEQIENWWEG